MSAKPNHFRIGLFTIGAVVLLVVALLAFGARSYFAQKTKFETVIPGEVSGLSVGSGVQLRGVPIGQVTRITFAWNLYPKSKSGLIVVEFEVHGNLFPLPPGTDMGTALKQAVARGLRAMVKGQGITGTSILSLEIIDPNTPFPSIDFKPRYYYVPSAPGRLSRMLESVQRSLDNLQKFDIGAVARGVTNLLASLDEFTHRLNQLDVQAIGTNANALLVDLRNTSTKVQAGIEDIRNTLKSMNLDSVSGNADKLLTGLQDSNFKLQAVLDDLGKAPLSETVADLQHTLGTLNEVLLDLKQYPSGFIFGKPPAPIKTVEPIKN